MAKRSIKSTMLSRLNPMDIRFGGRKVLFGFIIMGVGIALDVYLNRGLSDNMTHLLQFLSVGFFLGNGLEHCAHAIHDKKQSPTLSQLELKNTVEELKYQANTLQQAYGAISEQNRVLVEGMTAVHNAVKSVLPRRE